MNAIQFLMEWGVRSAALISFGAFLLWALRVKDSSVRLAAWAAMLAGSLLLPLMTVTLPRVPIRVMPATPEASFEPVQDSFIGESRYEAAANTPVLKTTTPLDWGLLGFTVYGLVAFALFLRLSIGLALSFRLLRRSKATGRAEGGIEIRESERVAAPVTLGIVRPAIVLPVDWNQWEQWKLDAVLAHERSHIARRDPALQLVSAIHRALLWHNPLTWFLHSRIVDAAEEASDDAAVSVTTDRVSYAEVLLDFMKRPALKSHVAGVPMARYARPDGRIDRILDATLISRGVTRWSVAVILVLGVPLSYLVASSSPERAVSRIAASVRTVIPDAVALCPLPLFDRLPEAPRLIAQVVPPPVVPPAPDTRPRFDAASIKPCDPNAPPPGRGGRGGPGGSDRLRKNCVTVIALIREAYVRFADGESRSPFLSPLTKIEGGPGWINSDQYTIEAESDHTFTPPIMNGPMTQVLLEERFQLKVHRETRDGPAYALTVAKAGSRIQPSKGIPCVAADFANAPIPFREGDVNPCEMMWVIPKGLNRVVTIRGLGIDQLIPMLTNASDRLVIDKTGIQGKVDLDLTFAIDGNSPGAPQSVDAVPVADDPTGPSIFTALEQQLGLKLEPARGSREYLVIDSISRPTPN